MINKILLNLQGVVRVPCRALNSYGGGQNDWFDFYNTIGGGKNTHLYFPDDWFFDHVDAKLNSWKLCPIIDDKGLYDLFFYDVNRPEAVASCHNGQWLDAHYCLTDVCHVAEACKAIGSVIVKPSRYSSGGHGISFWHGAEAESIEEILKKNKNCVVQRIVEQHPDIAVIHASSINSVRIMTMLLDGEVKNT